jgi:hypothetical protein
LASRTDGWTGGGGVELGGVLGGWCDVDGCGADDVGRGGLVDGRVVVGTAEVDGWAEDDTDEVRDRDVELDGAAEDVVDAVPDTVGCALVDPDVRPGTDAPGVPSGTPETSTEPLTNGIARSARCPPPRSNTAAPPAPSRQTTSTRTATRPTDTAAAGPTSPPARNAPHSAQTNSSSATRPQRGHVVISRLQ